MIRRVRREGVWLPLGSDPAMRELLAGELGEVYGAQGPERVERFEDGSGRLELRVGDETVVIDVPAGVTWVHFKPVTQMVEDQAQDSAGRPSKLGQVVARNLHGSGEAVRRACRVDVTAAIEAWAARHRARIVVEVDDGGLDEAAVEKAAHTSHAAAMKGLAAAAANAVSLPGLATRASRLQALIEKVDGGDEAAAQEVVEAVRAMLEGLPGDLTTDDLNDREFAAYRRQERWGRDVMTAEARATIEVADWGPGSFDELPELAQREVVGAVSRMRMFGPPKGGSSSPASG